MGKPIVWASAEAVRRNIFLIDGKSHIRFITGQTLILDPPLTDSEKIKVINALANQPCSIDTGQRIIQKIL